MRLLAALIRIIYDNRSLWTALFWVNVLGTVYGYIWYWDQLVKTAREMPMWLLPFVPDSPTASLWFTVSLGLLLYAPSMAKTELGGYIAALGAVSSVKYGVWAVAMNLAILYKGQLLVWQEWMLIASHLGMAVEALLFVRFFRVRIAHLALAALLLFWNDWLDYNVGIFPWLRTILLEDIGAIEAFTWCLTAASLIVVALVHRWSKIGHPPIR